MLLLLERRDPSSGWAAAVSAIRVTGGQTRTSQRGAAPAQFTLSAIVQGIVRSDAFLKQGSAATHQPAGTQVAARR